jgi:hypothetical protein
VGSGQGIFCVPVREKLHIGALDQQAFCTAFSLNATFDEQTGTRRSIYPFANQAKCNLLNQTFQLLKLNSLYTCSQEGSVTLLHHPQISKDYKITTIDEVISMLCGLFLLYGKANKSGDATSSITFQIPLIGNKEEKLTTLDALVHTCAQVHIFREYTLIEGKVTTVQRTLHDEEILECMSFLLKPLESLAKIRTLYPEEFLKSILTQYISQDSGNEDILQTIQKNRIKLI